jgi:monofunctional chorismate mutase
MDLEKLRQEIDEIDTQMCDLFARRMQVVSGIGKYKKENNMPVYHPSRARTVLQNVSKRLGPEFEGYGRTLYRTIFDLSESYETRMLSEGTDFFNLFKRFKEVDSAICEVDCIHYFSLNLHTRRAISDKYLAN